MKKATNKLSSSSNHWKPCASSCRKKFGNGRSPSLFDTRNKSISIDGSVAINRNRLRVDLLRTGLASVAALGSMGGHECDFDPERAEAMAQIWILFRRFVGNDRLQFFRYYVFRCGILSDKID